MFDGLGKEEGDRYTFEGVYANGKRSSGKLVWKDSSGFTYFYSGEFNNNEKFHGKGISVYILGSLADERGIYEGSFIDGLKDGKGYYKGVNGIKYRGDYKFGKKEGYGIIYNSDNTVAYKGRMKNGLPHGAGIAYIDNKAIDTEWLQGIEKKIIDTLDLQE